MLYLRPHQTERHVLRTIIQLVKLSHHLTHFFSIRVRASLSGAMGDGAYISRTEFLVRMSVNDAVFCHLQ